MPWSSLVLVVACTASPDPTPALIPAGPAVGVGAGAATPQPRTEPGEINPRLLRRFKPLRGNIELANGPAASVALTDLGRMLFFDRRLSKDGDLACNSCHQLDHFGVDNQRTSVGAKGARGRRNAPTVFQAAGQFTSFWDGRAGSVEEQAKAPILDPTEMAMPDAASVVAVLREVPGYVTAFRAAFPDQASPLTYDNVGRAIGAFERKLTTPSRWDTYLQGNRAALTGPELRGFKRFTDLGCMTCHTGELVGGSMFQKLGVVTAWPNQDDQGRFEVTGRSSDRMIFKVPGLRDVARTAPYFHDGSANTLEEAVTLMARYQVGEELGARDVEAIVSWLGALTGELPTKYIEPPPLPE